MSVADAVATIDAALAYAARGWRVVPIPARGKHPRLGAWQDAATTDTALIGQWWGTWPTDGVGIVTGERSGIFVLDVDTGPGKAGDDTLADLEATHGPLPDTVEAITGSGGRHLYFRWPGWNPGTNAGRLGPGLDVRAEGGQVLAPPTIHPNGTPYAWEASGDPDDVEVADAPDWLLELLRTTAAPTAVRRDRRPRPDGDPLPGDRFAASVTWPELLEADGAVYLGTRTERSTGEPYELWSRPPMPGEDTWEAHTSATLYYKGSDVLKVFTPNWMGLDINTGEVWRLAEGETYTRFGYFAARHFDGDHSAAAAELRRRHDEADIATWVADVTSGRAVVGTTPPGPLDVPPAAPDGVAVDDNGWEPVEWGELLAEGYEAPRPTLLERSDGQALFYEGRVNGVHGESGAGKSWVAFMAVAEELRAGRPALYIDLEDHPLSVRARLAVLGVTDDQVAAHLTYINPDRGASRDVIDGLAALVAATGMRLVVIDSVGEAMAIQAVKQNDDDDVARWFRGIPKRLAAAGAAVVVIDHVPKDRDAPSLFAIGSQRKRAAIDGAQYRIDQAQAFSRERAGKVRLVCAKDRSGTYAMGEVVAEVRIAPTMDPGRLEVVVAAPAERDPETGVVRRPTVLMERVSLYLEGNRAQTGRQIEAGVKGKGQAVRQALRQLVEEGWVKSHEAPMDDGRGKATWYWSDRPYRDDEADQLLAPTTTQRGDEASMDPRWHRPDAESGQVRPGASQARPAASRDAATPPIPGASPASPLGTEPRDAGRAWRGSSDLDEGRTNTDTPHPIPADDDRHGSSPHAVTDIDPDALI